MFPTCQGVWQSRKPVTKFSNKPRKPFNSTSKVFAKTAFLFRLLRPQSNSSRCAPHNKFVGPEPPPASFSQSGRFYHGLASRDYRGREVCARSVNSDVGPTAL